MTQLLVNGGASITIADVATVMEDEDPPEAHTLIAWVKHLTELKALKDGSNSD